MNRKKSMLLVLYFIYTFLLTACNQLKPAPEISFSFDEAGKYTVFEDFPASYGIEQAIDEGCFVKTNQAETFNSDVWANFVEGIEEGKNVNVRYVYYRENDETSGHVFDLFYQKGKYYVFDILADDQLKKPFDYLLELNEESDSTRISTTYMVLTNDKTLTFDQVERADNDNNYSLFLKEVLGEN